MTKAKKLIILSPHCDDAILALGGFILNGTQSIHVIDLFATTAWTALPGHLSVQEITAMNQREEENVLGHAEATVTMIETPEALMRGYTEWNQPLLRKADGGIADQLWDKIASEIRDCDTIYAPLAVGGHVDHRIVRSLILNHLDELFESEVSVYFYEDLPYSWYGGLEEALDFVRAYTALELFKHDVTVVFEQKLELLSMYKSQITESDLNKVKSYALQIQAGANIERVWKAINR